MREMWLAIVVFVVTFGGSATAHHSYGGYDPALTRLEGVVREFMWASPHSFVVIETAHGRRYMAEWGAPPALTRWGIDQSTLKPGDRVVIAGRLRMDTEGVLLLREIERPADGFRWPASRR